MKYIPILMNAAMVLAVLEGRKTQTRRIMNPQPHPDFLKRGVVSVTPQWPHQNGVRWFMADGCSQLVKCPYGQPGSRLWVRETWCGKYDDNEQQVYNKDGNLDSSCCWYRADGVEVRASDGDGFARLRKDGSEASPWIPSIHMPRWASRLTLEVVAVRVERLKAITREDAKAEGITEHLSEFAPGVYTEEAKDLWRNRTSVENFSYLWESINGPGSWDADPWVWVVEFKRVEQPRT